MSYLVQAGATLVQFVIGIYLLLVLLRFLFQLVRADFHNPISQTIVTLTNPPLRLLRRIVPGYAGVDWPSILLLILIQAVELCLLALLITGELPTIPGLMVLTIANLLKLTAYIFIFLIFLGVIISWISPGAYNPITVLIHQLTNPLLHPVRRRLPPMGGLDWSPMIVLLGIYLFLTLIVAPLLDYGNALNGYAIRLH